MDVGLIGFGLAGRAFHTPVIRAVPGLSLAAVLQRKSDEAAQLFPGTRVVRSLEDLLAISSIELVVIATPNQTHAPLAEACLNAGRHVVIDKPMATTVPEAVSLFRLAAKLGRVLTVYHNRRFDADFQALRSVVQSAELGRIVRFDSHYDRFRPAPKLGAWREQPGPGSGVLFDLAPHLLDHALTLFGPPEAMTADVRIERAGMKTDDAFDLFLHYPDGLRAHLSAAMLSAVPRPRFHMLGTKGAFVKRSFDPLENTLRFQTIPPDGSWMLEEEANWGELTIGEGQGTVTRRIPSRGDWREFYANVRDAIAGSAELIVTPRQALDVMVALETAVRSSAEQRTLHWSPVEL